MIFKVLAGPYITLDLPEDDPKTGEEILYRNKGVESRIAIRRPGATVQHLLDTRRKKKSFCVVAAVRGVEYRLDPALNLVELSNVLETTTPPSYVEFKNRKKLGDLDVISTVDFIRERLSEEVPEEDAQMHRGGGTLFAVDRKQTLEELYRGEVLDSGKVLSFESNSAKVGKAVFKSCTEEEGCIKSLIEGQGPIHFSAIQRLKVQHLEQGIREQFPRCKSALLVLRVDEKEIILPKKCKIRVVGEVVRKHANMELCLRDPSEGDAACWVTLNNFQRNWLDK